MATVLITGVSRGIGLALAKGYVERGDDVFGTWRRVDKSGPAQALDGSMSLLELDVTSDAQLAAAANKIGSKAIDLLIVNAGANNQARGGISDPLNTPGSWQTMMAVNVTGVFQTIRAFQPQVARAKGRIAVISSQMGSSTRAGAGSYGYRASKAAASNLVVNLALELKSQGIAIASYHPGWVKTDMGGQAASLTTKASADHLMARFDQLSLATTGGFFDYDGEVMPF